METNMAAKIEASQDPCEKQSSQKKAKRAKFDEEKLETGTEQLPTLSNVRFVKVLNNDVNTKTIFIHGKFSDEHQDEHDALISLERPAFDEKEAEDYLTDGTKLQLSFQNDIYSQYNAVTDPELNQLKVVTIMPATQKHILKYTRQSCYLINETPKNYAEITLPFIQENKHSVQWVYNILDHKAEVDRIIYEDLDPINGFILLPDLKWNQAQVSDMHLTAIVVKRGISSLRDLTAEHLPLLKNVLTKGKEAVVNKYKVNPQQLRIFFHYYPSYYHLHIHFMSSSSISGSCATAKAHLLDDVIDSLENIDGDFYKKKTITAVLGNQDPLLKKFIAEGKITE
eukprot:Seg1201.5 transcript_id=Seg1201.5/GoldUCD/mRNA.D3Y31 product="m7GpppX diphosphatase" protein_id=Seg1201.5/GoldUCD/D3Y31